MTENWLKLFEHRVSSNTGETAPSFIFTLQHQKESPFGGAGCIPFSAFMPRMGIIASPAWETITEPTLP
jgi:hypothetical protein